jgi:uncharacterized protein with von Willebrand factor type A (vWA) domain
MPYSAGSTDIANALRRACNTMFTSTNGDRPNAQNYLVLLTDGQSDANEILLKVVLNTIKQTSKQTNSLPSPPQFTAVVTSVGKKVAMSL